MDTWTILDPFNQPSGPFTEDEVTERLVNHGDCYVICPGGTDWELASDALTRRQREPKGLAPSPMATVIVSTIDKDEDGQPLNLYVNRERRVDRDVNELLGLAKGLIADARLLDAEVVALAQWLHSHPDAVASWPVSVLAQRLTRVVQDGLIDEVERAELKDLLEQVCGERPNVAVAMGMATRLAFDNPAPTIHFHGRSFACTGKFLFGTRRVCQAAIEERGGVFKQAVYSDTEYLVVGTVASRDWAHSTYGRKVEQALEFKQHGAPIAIVSEEHWSDALSQIRP